MWFGTQDGLNRYDGYEFRHFRSQKNNTESLSNNYVWDIYEDEKGILWIATFGGGLNRYDPETDRWKHFTHDNKDPKSFPSNRLFSITEGISGVLWIGSNEGLIRFDTKLESSEMFLAEDAGGNSYKDNYIGIVSDDIEGNLWLRSEDGLTFFNTQDGTATNFREAPFSNAFPLGDVYDIKRDEDFLLVCCDAGLLKIDPKTKSDTLLLPLKDMTIDGQNVAVRKVLALGHDEYAIGTSLGLILFNGKNQKKEVYTSSASDEKSLTHGYITALFKSTDQTFWAGTRNGLNWVDQLYPDFVHLRSIPGKEGLSNPNVNSFIEEKDSLLWIGTSDGLNLYNKNSNTFKVFRKEDKPFNGMTNNYILVLFKDSNGTKWVGTRGHGVFKVTDSYNFEPLSPINENLTSTSVHFMAEGKDGTLWLGTGGRGLWKYDPKTNTVKTYPSAKDGKGPHHSYIFSIVPDSQGNIWIGTPTGGLNLFDPQKERFLYFLNDPNNENSLSNDIILTLYEDQERTLWIGTNGRLNKLIPKLEPNMFEKLQGREKDSLFISYGRDAGFPNDVAYGILEDENENLWIPTNQGLAVFNTQSEKVVKNYDTSHGLQSNEFNQNGYHKGLSGNFYFGGVNGLNMVNPTKISPNNFPPPVVFTRLSIFNEEVPISTHSKKFGLGAPITALEAISLSWKHDVITFDFVGLSYKSPEKNLYSYRLDGFDEKWSPPGKSRSATYTNLDPGTYTFWVKAANNDGLWNTEGKSLQIHISSPPWASWYAYITYLLMAIGIFYLFLRYRIQKATREIRVQTEIEQARSQERELFRKRSARDFHDEAGTKITRIALIAELVKQNSKNNPKVQEQLEQLSDNLQELNVGMRDFIWALDPSKDNFYDTLNRFIDFASSFCETAGVRFSSGVLPEKFKELQLNMANRRHLLMIFKEALNNSIKHGNPKQAAFNAEVKEDGALQISLKDNGQGFSEETISKGHGIQNMKSRAEAMGADLKIESQKGKGTIITLELLITQMGDENASLK